MNIDVMNDAIKCVTCYQKGKTINDVRARVEDILGAPFIFVRRRDQFAEFSGELYNRKVSLFVVKRGYEAKGNPSTINLVITETRAMGVVDDLLRRQCTDLPLSEDSKRKLDATIPKRKHVKSKGLPYPIEFASQNYPFIIQNEKLYIENCGFVS